MNKTLILLILANLFSSVGRGMVLIGVSWYLVEVNKSGGPLGITMLFSTSIALIIGPYIATLIDRFSRKFILIVENTIGFGFLLICSIWVLFVGLTMPLLTTLYVILTLLAQVHFPTQAALVQETFKKEEYGKINSILEVQMQITQVLAGAFAGVILLYFNLNVVLAITSITFFSAVLLLLPIQYQFTSKITSGIKNKWYRDFAEGFNFILKDKKFLFFGIAVFTPFVALMVGNFLAPVFVNLDLNEPVTVFSTGEFLYAVGAGIAGISIMFILKKFNRFNLLFANLVSLATSIYIMVLLLESWAFVLTYFIMGWVVASTRLISQTIFMVVIPKHIIGRIMTTLDLFALIFRVLLLTILTLYIDIISASIGYMIIGSLLFIAGVIVFISRKHMKNLFKYQMEIDAEQTHINKSS